MKIQNITATQFKGRNFNHKLAPATVITGSNFAGKSAIIDALTFGLVGYVPRFGKKPTDAAALASGSALQVQLAFSDGRQITRALTQGKRGGFSYLASGDDAAIETPPVLLDAAEYFALSKPKRVGLVFEQANLPALGYTFEGITKELRAVKVEPMTAKHLEALKGIADAAEESAEEHETIQAWIDEIVQTLGGLKTTSEADVKAAGGFVEMLPALRAEDANTIPPAEAEARLQAARKERDAARQAHAMLAKAVRDAEENTRKASTITEQLAQLPALKHELEVLQGVFAELKPAATVVINGEAETRQQWHDARLAVQFAMQSRRALESERVANEKRKAELIGEKDCCPTCGACGSDWSLKIVQTYEAERARIGEALAGCDAAEAEAKRRVAELQASLDEIASAITARTEAIRRREQARRDAETERQKISQIEAMAEWVKTVQPPTDEQRAEVDRLEAEAARLSVEVAKAQTVRDATLAARNDAVRREQALAKLEDAEAKLAVVKAAAKLIGETKDKIASAVLSGFMEKASAFTDGITPGNLEFREGEFGWFVGATWVSHEAFSGAEQALAFAGLSVALCQQAPLRVVIMDEMGILTSDNKVRFVQRMLELIERGVIDQFIGVDVRDNSNTYAREFLGQGEPFKLIEL